MRLRVAAIVLLASLVLASYAVAQDGGHGPNSGGDGDSGGMGGMDGNSTDGHHDGREMRDGGRDASHRMEQRWDNMSADHREKGLERAEQHGLFARLSYDASTGMVDGRFLHAHLVASSATFHDYTTRDVLGNHTFFAQIAPSAFTPNGTVRVTGSVLHVLGTGLTVLVHNNPTGTFQARAEGGPVTLTFTLAAGTTIQNQTAREVKIGAGDVHGHLMTNGNASIAVSGSTLTVTLAAGDSAMFRAHPTGMDADLLHSQNKAFENRLLGTTAGIADGDGQALDDATEDGAAAEPTDIGAGHVRFNVSSEHHGPRVLFLDVDGSTVDPSHAAQLQVTLDGQAVPRDSIDNVVAQNRSAAAITTDANGVVHLVVRIPHFSSYTLALVDPVATGSGGSSGTSGSASGGSSASSSGGASQGSPGLDLAALALAIAGVAFVVRRRA